MPSLVQPRIVSDTSQLARLCVDHPLYSTETVEYVGVYQQARSDARAMFPCVILINRQMGSRCAYIGIPFDHPWFGSTHHIYEYLECHGGITYEELSAEYHWCGFDCLHAGDAQDVNLMNADGVQQYQTMNEVMSRQQSAIDGKPMRNTMSPEYPGNTIKSKEFCLEQLDSLGDQLAKVMVHCGGAIIDSDFINALLPLTQSGAIKDAASKYFREHIEEMLQRFNRVYQK